MSNHPHRAARHGHLLGHIRDSFAQAIDAYIDSEPGAPLPLVPYEIRYRERMISIAEACRRVWNCTDFLPGSNFTDCGIASENRRGAKPMLRLAHCCTNSRHRQNRRRSRYSSASALRRTRCRVARARMLDVCREWRFRLI